MPDAHALIGRARMLALLVPVTVFGCASEPAMNPMPPAVSVLGTLPDTLPATRSGRYTLIEIAADEAQRDLMQQVIDVTAPQGLAASVADMLRYVLLRSGYSVCPGEALARFETLPLPAAHFHLGPISLREALGVLTGPAWQLAVDDVARQICFTPTSPMIVAVTPGATP